MGGGKDIQILQIPPAELGMRHHFDLPLPLLGDLHRVAEVADAVVDLDLVVQELLEGGDVEDLVRGGLGGVDDELYIPVLSAEEDICFLSLLSFLFLDGGWRGR